METVAPKIRYHLLDELRGFAVVCMVFFHGFYTMWLFGISAGESLFNFFMPAEPFFAGFFVLLSGLCSVLSSSNAKRGGILLLISLALTGATFLLSLADICGVIYFGILHLLSVCMLLAALLIKPLKRIGFRSAVIISAVLFLIFLFIFNLPDGFVGFGSTRIFLPHNLYKSGYMFFLGFPNNSFSSDDYFPLLPWAFLFFAGVFAGIAFKVKGFPRFLKKQRVPFLAFFGRHALIIYLVHQPVIYGILMLLSTIFGF